jgi:hypothetical protein
MRAARSHVPYFSQWESRELVADFVGDGSAIADRHDPQWASSGARAVEEYDAWARHVCGMACLKMILAARTGRIVPTLELARRCTAYGGYTVDPESGLIKGLIYAPFVKFIGEEFAIRAEVVTNVTTAQLPEIFQRAEFVMASVHPWIRWPQREPPGRGGHLVLAIECSASEITFHNPSGHDRSSQEQASLSLEQFDRFFAGRGVAIY